MNNNNALQLNSLSCAVWIFDYLTKVNLSISLNPKRIYLNNADPITSLWKTSDRKLSKKIIHNFCVPPLQTHASHTEPAHLNSQKKNLCSTINNMRIWERNVVSWGARRKKAKPENCVQYVHTYNLSLLLCVYIYRI